MSSTGNGARLTSASSAGPEAAVGQHRGMDPAGQLAQLVEPLRELSCAPSRMLRAFGGSFSSVASIMRRSSASDTSRCCAPSWRLRSSRRRSASPASHDAGARGGQLLVRVGVRERLRDQVREVAQPLLDARAQGLVGARAGGQRSPQLAADGDGRGDRGACSRSAAASRRGSRWRPRSGPPAAGRRCAGPWRPRCRRRGRRCCRAGG